MTYIALLVSKPLMHRRFTMIRYIIDILLTYLLIYIFDGESCAVAICIKLLRTIVHLSTGIVRERISKAGYGNTVTLDDRSFSDFIDVRSLGIGFDDGLRLTYRVYMHITRSSRSTVNLSANLTKHPGDKECVKRDTSCETGTKGPLRRPPVGAGTMATSAI